MGLGGHLLWTSVIRTLHEASGRPVRVCHTPLVSDLAAGRLYCGDVSLAGDPVFLHNPRVECPPARPKRPAVRAIDRAVHAAIRRLGLERAYEWVVWSLSAARARRTGQFDAHLDLKRHSYVAREDPHRMVWKAGGHIIDIILANYGTKARDHRCEMYFSDREEDEVRALRASHALEGDYVVIEPNSNQTWYGDLRAWPLERWQPVVDDIVVAGRAPVVQIGEAGRPVLERVVDLTGRLTFRIAVLVLRHARLFLGLDGGLMNAANAVGTPAVIVWGGTALPEFAGYPDLHTIICRYVDCAPCGLRGGCPYDKKCLTQIGVDEVRAHVARGLTLGTEAG